MIKKMIILLAFCLGYAAYAADPGGYLFVTFRGEGTPMTEQIYFMISKNGQDWTALKDSNPVLVSTVGEKGVRDPFILRSHDNSKFYLIATDLSIHLNGNWGRAQTSASKSIVIWESQDLVNWSEPRLVKVAPDNAGCTWAPEAVYDEARGEYMVFWASKTSTDNFAKQRIWAAYTKDFKEFSEPFVYIERPNHIIDTSIINENGTYYRFSKDETVKAITMDKSKTLMGDWEEVKEFSLAGMQGYEGPTCFMIQPPENDKPAKWCLLLDYYSKGRGYQPYMTDNLSTGNFRPAKGMNFPFHPVRHGTVMPITTQEMDRLTRKWGTFELTSTSDQVKANNVVVNRDDRTVELPVLPDTDLTKLDPQFKTTGIMTISPKGPQDFSKGPVKYQIGEDHTFQVSAVKNHNPVLAGYYADPDCIYSEKTGKYYIYPTSDGFNGWSGSYFKTFSSPDLVHWTDEGIILDLRKDVNWANSRAWAPSIIEKKVGSEYRYFYYFCAEGKIGVATATSPTGPFTDLGRPLISSRPAGANSGQQIDPAVFHDPVSGKDYLYWGNSYLAVAELNDDMMSIDQSTIKIMTPDRTFREGVHVFYRNGLYYFHWSQDDTRSPNYCVRYATAKSPTGPLVIPDHNIVVQKRLHDGIYATGHNSTIKVHGKDEWYIVYHRFTYPKGVSMPDGSGGYHREVCIDKMEFDEAGNILQVIPTHKGINPVK